MKGEIGPPTARAIEEGGKGKEESGETRSGEK